VQYLISFFASVEQYRLENINEMPHIRATHLARQLFHQNINRHNWIQNIHELGKEKVKSEADIGHCKNLS